MTERNFKVGDIVTVKGLGDYKILSIEKNIFCDVVYHCEGHNYCKAWFSEREIVRVASPATIILRHKEATARNIGCISPDCWCREYVS